MADAAIDETKGAPFRKGSNNVSGARAHQDVAKKWKRAPIDLFHDQLYRVKVRTKKR